MVDNEQNNQQDSFSVGCVHYIVLMGIIGVAGLLSTRLPEYTRDAFTATGVTIALGVFSLLRGWLTGKVSPVLAVLITFLISFNWHKWPLAFRVQWSVTFVVVAIVGYAVGLWLRKRQRSR